MDVPLSCLGARLQNLWDQKKHTDRYKYSNIEFFLHTKALHDVFHRYHQICATTVNRNVAFINFQVGAHNMILEPNKDPTKQAHNAGFMITDNNFNDIVKEWCNP